MDGMKSAADQYDFGASLAQNGLLGLVPAFRSLAANMGPLPTTCSLLPNIALCQRHIWLVTGSWNILSLSFKFNNSFMSRACGSLCLP